MKSRLLLLSILLILLLTSCDKETRLKNLLEGRTWNATVDTQINGGPINTSTGTFVFDKEEFVYTSTLTDSQGNTTTTENLGYSIGSEAVFITLSDSSGNYQYNVNINEKKLQEWSFSDEINSVSVYNKITLTR